jgi:mRNA-degrading endonuclease RelE of RelBE toxin-antitoxin system
VRSRRWQLLVAPSAERSLARLPEKAASAVVEFLLGPLSENPLQVGHELRGELEGLFAARRGPYRVVHEVIASKGEIHVLRIDHRADVYRPR